MCNMKKHLVILATLLIGAGIMAGQANKDADPNPQPAKHEQPALHAANGEQSQTKSGNGEEKDGNKPPTGNAALERPQIWWLDSNWVLVIIAGFTGLVICWQSFETKNAAKAALLNAQALINAERPWIMATIEESIGPRGGFQLYVTNKGRSPAMITEAQLGCAVATDISALPAMAPYGPGSMAKDRIILNDEKQVMTWFSVGTLKNIVGEDFPIGPSENDVFVFGRIVYRDLLSPSNFAEHETRWIGLYQFPTEVDGDSIFHFQGIGVADEYDRYS